MPSVSIGKWDNQENPKSKIPNLGPRMKHGSITEKSKSVFDPYSIRGYLLRTSGCRFKPINRSCLLFMFLLEVALRAATSCVNTIHSCTLLLHFRNLFQSLHGSGDFPPGRGHTRGRFWRSSSS